MKSIRFISVILATLLALFLICATSLSTFASGGETDVPPAPAEAQSEDGDDSVLSAKAYAAAIALGLVGAAGAIGMGMAIAKSADSMARQPEAAGKINSAMMLGLVFIETVIIYALIVAILIIFVL